MIKTKNGDISTAGSANEKSGEKNLQHITLTW